MDLASNRLFPVYPQADSLHHGAQIAAAMNRVHASGHYILGPEVEAFESEFAAYLGAGHAIGVASGTDAIEIMLRALGIGRGMKVEVPSLTAVAVAAGVTRAGAELVLADCEPDTFTLCPHSLRKLLQSPEGHRIKAALVVHLYGQPADWARLQEVADEHCILLLEDDAQAHGALWQGRKVGTLGKAAPLLCAMPGQVVLVELARNFGEHAAVLEGYRQAKGRYVVNLDDDLQNPVSEALNLLAQLQASGADVVYSHYEQKQHHWARNLGSRCINRIATLLLDKPRDLYLSSFRAVRRELLDRIVQYRGPYPYIDGLILGATNRIARLTVAHQPRVEGRSSYTLRKLLRLAATVCFDFSIMPLRIAGVLGIALCLLGLVMFAIVLVEAFTSGRVQPGWGSLMAVITIFSGAQLLMLGIIGEYVGRAFLTVSGKPQSLVRQVTIHQPAL